MSFLSVQPQGSYKKLENELPNKCLIDTYILIIMTLSNNKLDVVLIATIRPEILHITLNSFKHKFLDFTDTDIRLIANIDPLGESQYTQENIADICRLYFNDVIVRMPKTSSFSDAVKWCWSQVDSDFFFHLEDDWCLKSAIDNSIIIRSFDDVNVVSVRLNLTRNSKFRIDKEGRVHSPSLSLNPSVFRTAYIRELLSRFDTNRDPEKQFSHNPDLSPKLEPSL